MAAVAENRTILKDVDGAQLIVAEQSSLQITATVLDEAGVAVQLAVITAITLTLYNRDSATQDIINSLSDQNVLNVDRGTMHPTNGLLTLQLLPADNAIVNPASDLEWHRALIEGIYGGGKAFKYEIEWPVRNLGKVS